MNVLAVDDEKLALAALADAIGEAVPGAEVHACRSGAQALEVAADQQVDVAFLDIELRDTTGLELARRLIGIHAETNIVFVTGYAEYVLDAFDLYASDYLLKPVSTEKVSKALSNLRHPVAMPTEKPLRVRCFGTFEVFCGDQPVAFSRKRSKELLAFLVDRSGAACTAAQIADALWEDGEYGTSRKNQIQNLLTELRRSLDAVGAQDVLLHQRRNSYAVDVGLIDCDLYRYLDDDPQVATLYQGEYMTQYPWAEATAGVLSRHAAGR